MRNGGVERAGDHQRIGSGNNAITQGTNFIQTSFARPSHQTRGLLWLCDLPCTWALPGVRIRAPE